MQSGWKHRLEQWAPEPPPQVWDHLSEQLDEVQQPRFAQKLHDYAPAPPPAAWATIAGQLEPQKTAPVVPIIPRGRWLRVTSIAASLLFAVFLIRQYYGQEGAGRPVAAPLQQQTVLPLPASPPEIARSSSPATADYTPKHETQRGMIRFAHSMYTGATAGEPLQRTRPQPVAGMRIFEVVPAAHEVDETPFDRYIVVPVTDDFAIRLPKKLYDLYQCGELPLPAGCSELMMQLKQQAADPSVVTTADFSGLLELVRQVEQ